MSFHPHFVSWTTVLFRQPSHSHRALCKPASGRLQGVPVSYIGPSCCKRRSDNPLGFRDSYGMVFASDEQVRMWALAPRMGECRTPHPTDGNGTAGPVSHSHSDIRCSRTWMTVS